MDIRRVFLIVLDSFGVGALPDAPDFGDSPSCNTFLSCMRTGALDVPNLKKLGLFHLSPDAPGEAPIGAYGRMAERSRGKDTTIGHWEIAGLISPRPLPTYPHGFPQDLLDEFSRRTGRGILCNRPYSGTQVIADYGEEQIRTGKLIVYTSADSVFQIAAHEKYIGLEELYRCCRIARELLTGPHAVGRVIARPYVGEAPHFMRTANRHDFSLTPPGMTVLEALRRAGRDVIAVGKINDIFAGQGVTRAIPTKSNRDGMEKTRALLDEPFHGLCFVNLVEFDSLYGHRRDSLGYAQALNEFDAWLGPFMEAMDPSDLLMITADHGCDPCAAGTDHTREYVPLLVYGRQIRPVGLGTRASYADAGKTIAELFAAQDPVQGDSFLSRIRTDAICETVVRHIDGDYLLVQRSLSKRRYPGAWDVGAGGHIEPGETPEQAARRELLEETGIRAETLTPLCRQTAEDAGERYEVHTFFTCVDVPKNAITLQADECAAYRWVDPETFEHFVKDELLGPKRARLTQALFPPNKN